MCGRLVMTCENTLWQTWKFTPAGRYRVEAVAKLADGTASNTARFAFDQN